ncbi:MAG: tetratricopeptide repeat protein [Anaerolineales bacterium]|nr:tetratricopeptide repeat protein [Anaerolineales bacterium]
MLSKIMKVLHSPRTILVLMVIILLLLSSTPREIQRDDAINRAQLAAAEGNAEAAYLAVREALELDPAFPGLEFTAAELAYHSGLLEDAAALLSSISVSEPNNIRTRCLLGWVQLEQGHLAQASYNQSPRCEDHLDFLIQLRDAYLDAGEIDLARSLSEDIFMQSPGNLEALIAFAFLTAVEAPEDALALLRAALQEETDPSSLLPALIRTIEDTRADHNLGYSLAAVAQTFVRHQRWQLARAALEKALELEPDYVEAHAYLGYVLERLNLDGIQHLETAHELDPTSVIASFFLADYWKRNQLPIRAVALLEQLLQEHPADPAVYAELAAAYAASGDLSSARREYLEAVQLAPDQSTFWRALAEFSLQYEIELQTLGIPAARNALILSPGDSDSLDTLGYAHLLAGETLLAERMLRQAIHADPGSSLPWLHWGLLRQILGDTFTAREAFQYAVELDPGGEVGVRAQRILDNLTP